MTCKDCKYLSIVTDSEGEAHLYCKHTGYFINFDPLNDLADCDLAKEKEMHNENSKALCEILTDACIIYEVKNSYSEVMHELNKILMNDHRGYLVLINAETNKTITIMVDHIVAIMPKNDKKSKR